MDIFNNTVNWDVIDRFFASINFNTELLAGFDKIYVLASGGIDSTLLCAWIDHHYPVKTWFVNSYNPYEWCYTMDQIQETGKLIILKKETEYARILKQSFLDLNLVAAARKRGCYSKKYFKCCMQLKHQIFKKDPRFKQPNTCVISGIKRGDGMQRRIWLTQLANGKQPHNHTNGEPAFHHLHKSGQLYYYPYRDYRHVELPYEIILELRKLYPDVEHSGCACCPILLLFQIKSEHDRYEKSLRFYKKLVKSGQLHPSRDLQKYTGIQVNTLDDYEVL